MREKLNENPLVQVALLGVLLVLGVLLLTTMGGGGESEAESEPETEASIATTSAPAITPAGETPSTGAAAAPPEFPPPPRAVTAAFQSGETVVLLVVREGGIDDRIVRADTAALAAIPKVALFVVPVRRIARYAAITEGVGVNRVPALVVLRPKALSHGVPTASVSYGYQGAQSVLQAVVDARYKGRTLSYHP
jgi:pyruvate/2-oxoglutarate dehydrogenase complex dihydrolipoamide acyltransferase (E2) component